MLDWLNSLPDAVIVIGFAVLMGGLIVVIPLIMRSLPIVAPTPENTEFVMRIQGTLFVMSGFALAFTLAQAQANVRHVDALVAAEAAHINNLDRILTRYGEPSVAAIRPDLMTYANSVATLEWEAMHHDKEHEPTMQAFAPVARAITAINPTNARQATLFTEMMKSIDQIMESRALRLEAVHIRAARHLLGRGDLRHGGAGAGQLRHRAHALPQPRARHPDVGAGSLHRHPVHHRPSVPRRVEHWAGRLRQGDERDEGASG